MKDEILKIINPIHQLSCDDKWKIAEIISKAKIRGHIQYNAFYWYIQVDQWWERLTVGQYVEVKGMEEEPIKFQPAHITKEMLLCEVPKPETEYDSEGHAHYPLQMYEDEYNQAQSKVLVEGDIKLYNTTFEIDNRLELSFRNQYTWLQVMVLWQIQEIKPLPLNWTENVIKTLIP